MAGKRLSDNSIAKLRRLLDSSKGTGKGAIRPQMSSSIMLGVAMQDIEKGSWGTVALYGLPDGSDKGSEVALGEDHEFEVYARLGEVSEGARVYLYLLPGGLEVINAECDPEGV